MRVINISHQVINLYLQLLSTLNRESKLVLFERFSQMLAEEKEKETSFFSLFGALKNEESAEEMIENIRNSRVNNREIEPL